MIFLSGIDDIVGVSIPTPPKASINPPTNPTIGQPPSNAIPVVPPMRMRAGPTGQIARGTGSDDDTGGGLPLTRTIRPRNIGDATATLPAFPVPGAGEEATSLGPQKIRAGSSGTIRSIGASIQQNPSEHLLDVVRATMQPLLDTLAELPSDERQKSLTEAFNLLSLPDAAPAVERLSLKFMAKGAQPSIAFKEALARVLATNIAVVMPEQYAAARLRAAARMEEGAAQAGLGNWAGDAYRGTKKIAKGTVKVADKIATVTKRVACSDLGKAAADVRQKGSGAATCGAAKIAAGVADKVSSPAPVAPPTPAPVAPMASPELAKAVRKIKMGPGGLRRDGGARAVPAPAKKSSKMMWYVLGGLVLVGGGFYIYKKQAKPVTETK